MRTRKGYLGAFLAWWAKIIAACSGSRLAERRTWRGWPGARRQVESSVWRPLRRTDLRPAPTRGTIATRWTSISVTDSGRLVSANAAREVMEVEESFDPIQRHLAPPDVERRL
jgi:hypothetical protein